MQQKGSLTVAIEDWTFAHLRRVETLWGPHGYHRYPAKFIPQLVCRLIETYSAPGELVGDPFLGSATTGIEALRLPRHWCGFVVSSTTASISVSSSKAPLLNQMGCAVMRPS